MLCLQFSTSAVFSKLQTTKALARSASLLPPLMMVQTSGYSEHVMDEGEKWGIKKEKKLGMNEGLEEGMNLGHKEEMNLGHKEGYQIAKEGFNRIIQAVKDKATLKMPNTHKTAIQTNNELQQQSTAMQMAPTSTANTITQMEPNDKLS